MATRRRLLVVDDEAMMERFLSELLDGTYEVRGVTTAAEGLRVAHAWRPNIVLMDCTLPDFDGVSACKALRESPVTGHIPVVHMSGHQDNLLVQKSDAAGAAAFVNKPIPVDRLEALLDEVCTSACVH